ncbi:uncharacterized protein L203_100851 [Cryptococcus depauperatus CBS 7841]|uniref:Uncharacterized protein n=1 Tax=Cryptococcus depauperatus CBS 7841 TaxID=1295531 RepID=A0A1E3IXM5_9TREE|nr:hypothetical protein L203_00642 [Cryptococcus depauperatus CBS 7841]
MSSSNLCKLTLDDGTHYDLSQLSSTKHDYVAQVGETSYNLNVCRGVIGELYKVEDPDQVGGYIKKEGGDFSLGKANTNLTLTPMTNEPMLIMADGSPCPLNPSASSSTAIRFICNPTVFGAGTPILVASLPPIDPCQFYFEWSTHVACPTNAKAELKQHHYYIAFGAILAIAILTWFGGLTLYNRFVLKRRGLSQFPVPSFHFPSISLKSSLSSESSKPRWGSWRRRSNQAGYNHIRADDNDEEDGFAGRFSLEESDEDAEDLTAAGVGDASVWRSHQQDQQREGGHNKGKAKVGAHEGLVNI